MMIAIAGHATCASLQARTLAKPTQVANANIVKLYQASPIAIRLKPWRAVAADTLARRVPAGHLDVEWILRRQLSPYCRSMA
jgi:hypothetical protein